MTTSRTSPGNDVHITVCAREDTAHERAGITEHADGGARVVGGSLRQQRHGVTVRLSIVKEEIGIARQTVSQVHPG